MALDFLKFGSVFFNFFFEKVIEVFVSAPKQVNIITSFTCISAGDAVYLHYLLKAFCPIVLLLIRVICDQNHVCYVLIKREPIKKTRVITEGSRVMIFWCIITYCTRHAIVIAKNKYIFFFLR